MVVNSFRNLVEELEKRSKEAESQGKTRNSSVIKKQRKELQSIYDKVDPDIINSPVVLELLHDVIYNYNEESLNDFINIEEVNGSIIIEIHHEKKDIENTSALIEVKKDKIGDKNYIDITGMYAPVSNKDNKYEIQYVKDIYSLEGLEMQRAEAYCPLSPMDDFRKYSHQRMVSDMNFFRPKYNEFRGFRSSEKADCEKCKLVTRGKFFGDEGNIGLCKLNLQESNGKDDRTYIGPAPFTEIGPHLSFDRNDGDIEIELGKNFEHNMKKAEEKFGGEIGWKALVGARKYRSYSDRLYKYAKEKAGITQELDEGRE